MSVNRNSPPKWFQTNKPHCQEGEKEKKLTLELGSWVSEISSSAGSLSILGSRSTEEGEEAGEENRQEVGEIWRGWRRWNGGGRKRRLLHWSKGVLEKEAEIEEGEEREGRHGEWLRMVEEKLDVKSSINESLCYCNWIQQRIGRCLQVSRIKEDNDTVKAKLLNMASTFGLV